MRFEDERSRFAGCQAGQTDEVAETYAANLKVSGSEDIRGRSRSTSSIEPAEASSTGIEPVIS
jgi:hypothetical protein